MADTLQQLKTKLKKGEKHISSLKMRGTLTVEMEKLMDDELQKLRDKIRDLEVYTHGQ